MNSYNHSTSRNSIGSSDRTAVVSVKAQSLGLGLSFGSCVVIGFLLESSSVALSGTTRLGIQGYKGG